MHFLVRIYTASISLFPCIEGSNPSTLAAFAGIIVGVSAWVIWHDEPIFGSTNDPYGFGSVNDPYGDAGEWTTSELRGYLQAVCLTGLPFLFFYFILFSFLLCFLCSPC